MDPAFDTDSLCASDGPRGAWGFRAFKRGLDVLASLGALAALGLPLLVIGLLVRLGSPGAAVFRQRRTGVGGRPFEMLKFRSMRSDVAAFGQSPRSGEDPRLTRLGRWLRETSLDELPQLINVLCGSMSLVGPRPLYERQAAQWDGRQRRRLDVRPGITGYAQAYGRASMVLEDKIDFDLYYVANASVRLDLGILVRTAANVLLGRSGDVYEQRYSRGKERETDR